jgi:hypothetical protein
MPKLPKTGGNPVLRNLMNNAHYLSSAFHIFYNVAWIAWSELLVPVLCSCFVAEDRLSAVGDSS